MGFSSISPGSNLAALAIPLSLLLASCTTSDGDIFAHPTSTSTPARVAVTSSDSGGMAGSIAPPTILRAFVGVEADRLRREVGESTMQSSAHFVFVAPRPSPELPQIAQLLERTHGTFFEVFGGMKDRLAPIKAPLVWMVFDGRSEYEDYAQTADGMDMSWSKAYYSAQTNRVAIAIQNEGDRAANGDTTSGTTTSAAATPLANNEKLFAQITHEAGHQLAFNSGLQARGVMYPLWASEGLATNFELDSDGKLGPTASNPLRSRHLAAASADKRLLPLEQWVGYSRVPVGRPAQINAVYSQSWAFFRFLYEHRRDQLHDYLAHMARQQPGRRTEEALKKEFVRFFGEPEALTKTWEDYVASVIAKTAD